jgi:transposase-like protein
MAKRRTGHDVKVAAVKEYLTGDQTRGAVAKKYGVSEQSLSNWLREFRAASGVTEEPPGLKAPEGDEVSRLRAENAKLRQLVAMLVEIQVQTP